MDIRRHDLHFRLENEPESLKYLDDLWEDAHKPDVSDQYVEDSAAEMEALWYDRVKKGK
jgi:hypothetical protein